MFFVVLYKRMFMTEAEYNVIFKVFGLTRVSGSEAADGHGLAARGAFPGGGFSGRGTVECQTKEGRWADVKRVNWVLLMLVLIGFVIGRFIGTFFEGTFLNYGQAFGLSSPVVLDLGFIVLTFGLTINITIASVVGVIISLVVYRFIK